MAVSEFYTTGFTTKRKTITADAGGAPIETWAANLTSLSGYLRELGATERTVNAKKDIASSHLFLCAHGTDIVAYDILVDSSSNEYAVISTRNPGGKNHHLEVTKFSLTIIVSPTIGVIS